MSLAENDYDLKKKYDFRQIEIVREYETPSPLTPCEHTKIQQVFFNLLKNGAEAMHAKPQTAGEVNPRFTLRVRGESDMLRIEIEDNGADMSDAVRKRVFEPFFTTKEVGVGTGLGLSVSYFIVTENHGGAMAVESSPGKGSTFIIHLPLERQ